MISAVVNTLNEEKNIRFCLNCLGWCNEIVIVDMYSSDNTLKIAKEFTDKIFLHKRTLYFDEARKFAVQMAKNEWVLIVDADELIPKSLAQKLKDIAENESFDVVYIPRINYIMGTWIKHTGWWPDYQPRFFKKSNMKFTGILHAYLSPRGKSLKLKPLPSNAIIHLNYLDSNQFIERLNRYTYIEAKQMRDRNLTFDFWSLIKSVVKEFIIRFVKCKGYKDGFRGIALGILMIFYRIVSFIKLWEIQEYQRTGSPKDIYENIRKSVVEQWSDQTSV